MRTRYRYSAADLLTMEEMIYEGRTDAQIGRALGATANAVNIARKRHKIPSRRKVLLTSRAVARHLGIPCEKTVVVWIKAGFLKARKGQRVGRSRMWYIEEEALLDFLADPAYWHRWEPERVNGYLRAWVAEMRNGVRFLTTGQVGAIFHVKHTTVNDWIHKGLLPAVRRGNWLIKNSDLEGFVAPCERPRRIP